jgi:hypothetical protein
MMRRKVPEGMRSLKKTIDSNLISLVVEINLHNILKLPEILTTFAKGVLK